MNRELNGSSRHGLTYNSYITVCAHCMTSSINDNNTSETYCVLISRSNWSISSRLVAPFCLAGKRSSPTSESRCPLIRFTLARLRIPAPRQFHDGTLIGQGAKRLKWLTRRQSMCAVGRSVIATYKLAILHHVNCCRRIFLSFFFSGPCSIVTLCTNFCLPYRHVCVHVRASVCM